jgi:hypothetical protein
MPKKHGIRIKKRRVLKMKKKDFIVESLEKVINEVGIRYVITRGFVFLLDSLAKYAAETVNESIDNLEPEPYYRSYKILSEGINEAINNALYK